MDGALECRFRYPLLKITLFCGLHSRGRKVHLAIVSKYPLYNYFVRNKVLSLVYLSYLLLLSTLSLLVFCIFEYNSEILGYAKNL